MLRSIRLVLAAALFAAFIAPTAQAQMADDPILSDRPGFSTSASTIGGGTFQAELGYDFTSIGDQFGDEGQSIHSAGLLLLRYGVADAVEVRANVGSLGFLEQPTGATTPGATPETELQSGYNGAEIEAKARLLQTPTTTVGVFSATSLPLGSGPFESFDDRARQTLLALFDGALGEGLSFTINVGPSFFWSGGVQEDRALSARFISTLSFGITERVGGYVDYSGEYRDGPNENFVGTGLTYLLDPDTQIDINGGVRVDSNQDSFFLGLGLSHRF